MLIPSSGLPAIWNNPFTSFSSTLVPSLFIDVTVLPVFIPSTCPIDSTNSFVPSAFTPIIVNLPSFWLSLFSQHICTSLYWFNSGIICPNVSFAVTNVCGFTTAKLLKLSSSIPIISAASFSSLSKLIFLLFSSYFSISLFDNFMSFSVISCNENSAALRSSIA